MRRTAVLTGDLVNSSGMSAALVARAFDLLADSAATQAAWHGAPLRFSRNRGDGWQAVLERPALALRSALAFRAALRAAGRTLDTHVAIAEGPLDLPAEADLNSRTDPVLVRSGQALDAMKADASPRRMTYAGSGTRNAVATLADHLAQGWTPVQALAISRVIAPGRPTHASVAQSLGKSRQAVSKALRAAGYDFLELALEDIEQDHD